MKQLPKLHYAGIDWATRPMRSAWLTRPARSVPASRSPTPAGSSPGSSSVWAPSGWTSVAIERSYGPAGGLHAGGRPARGGGRGRSRPCAAGIQASGARSIPPTPTCWLMCCAPTATAWPRSPPKVRADQDPAALSRTRKDLVEARVADQPAHQPAGRLLSGAIGLFQSCTRQPPSRSCAIHRPRRRRPYPGQPRLPPAPPALQRPHARQRAAPRLQTARLAGISPAEGGRTGSLRASPYWTPSRSPAARTRTDRVIERLEVTPTSASSPVCPGPATGSGRRLLAELGDVQAASLRGSPGRPGWAAPITITSGKRRVVKFRWACDKKRQGGAARLRR